MVDLYERDSRIISVCNKDDEVAGRSGIYVMLRGEKHVQQRLRESRDDGEIPSESFLRS